jgi:hypothetical protein
MRDGCFAGGAASLWRPFPSMGRARKARRPSAGAEARTPGCWRRANRSCAGALPPKRSASFLSFPHCGRGRSPSLWRWLLLHELDDRSGERFSDAEVAALKRLMPFLGLTIKSTSLCPYREYAGRRRRRGAGRRQGPALFAPPPDRTPGNVAGHSPERAGRSRPARISYVLNGEDPMRAIGGRGRYPWSVE